MLVRGKVTGNEIPRFKHRWFGVLEVEAEGERYRIYMTGNVAQWFLSGDEVEIEIMGKPKEKEG
ncbi:hypothetical protein, partial [Thermococcus sp.]